MSERLALNEGGGLVPRDRSEEFRARKADLVTLPPQIAGTNCGNCSFVREVSGGVGYCAHPKVRQYVTARMCCALWDAPGTIREF